MHSYNLFSDNKTGHLQSVVHHLVNGLLGDDDGIHHPHNILLKPWSGERANTGGVVLVPGQGLLYVQSVKLDPSQGEPLPYSPPPK